MDFTDSEEQIALVEMAEAVLTRLGPSDTSTLVGYDESLWKVLADNGFVRAALPESCGGDQLGLPAVASLLTLLGARAAVTPYLVTAALGVLPLLAYGVADRHVDDLRAAGDGAILTAALAEVGDAIPDRPQTTLRASGDGLRLSGRKVAVPYASQARLLSVSTDRGVVVVSPQQTGVSIISTTSSSGAPEATVDFDDVDVPAAALIGTECGTINDYARCAAAAFADGLAAGALRLTADHLASREQFGRPLATFQAVAQQVADAYVVARTVHLVAVSAVWRVSEGLDAQADTALAAYWVASELPSMMQQCHHLHGGTGADVTYPMHRYFSTAKDLARYVGGQSATLDRLGAQCSSI